jgi:dTDP-N-acetylfucosamine:lipid II N-acetylfucosaminyltransferase
LEWLGGDYYDLLPGGEACLLGDGTAALLAKLKKTPRNRILWAANFVKKTIKRPFWSSITDFQAIKFAAIKRVNYFSSPIQDDYVLLRSALGDNFGADYVQLNYGSLEETLKKGHGGLTGNDILIGNSASATNNHIEAINLLSSIELGDRKIVVPLSYGDDLYGDAIERYGNRLFGEKFMPIRRFMPIDEYNELISRCSIVIMNHRRQQALGTIYTILYYGAKLFMDHRSIVYEFFKRHGASVFPIQDMIDLGAKAFSPLSYAEKKKNIEVLESFWSHEVVMDNARKFVKLMQENRRGCA